MHRYPKLSKTIAFVGVFAASSLVELRAQAVSAPSNEPAPSGRVVTLPRSEETRATLNEGETLELAPFEVRVEKDEGFVAASSLAGGRIAADLKDTPVAYSVMTKDFIEALGLTSLSEMVQWMPNAYELPDNNQTFDTGGTVRMSSRGISSNTPQRNFFPINYDFDSYNVERLDFARGPNAVLFGATGVGGTANSFTKRARTDRRFADVTVAAGSWDNLRTTIDYNLPLANKSAALRLNTLYQDRGGWQDFDEQTRKGATLAATWKPFRRTEIRAEAEIGDMDRAVIVTNVNDYLSGWDGVTTYSAPIPTTVNATTLSGRGITRQGRTIVYTPGTGGNVMMNYEGWGATQGGNASAATPAGGTLVVGPTANIQNTSIIYNQNLPENLYDLAINGSQFRIPDRTFSTFTSGPIFGLKNREFTLSVSHQIGQRLFLEVAGNRGETDTNSDAGISRMMSRVYIDVNERLPDGTSNPHFKELYAQTQSYPLERFQTRENVRATLAYIMEKNRLGDFTINTIAGLTSSREDSNIYRYMLKINPDPRYWPTQHQPHFRYYLNTQSNRPMPKPDSWTFIDPFNNETTTVAAGNVRDYTNTSFNRVTDRDFTYVQAALSGKMLNQKLNVLGAFRVDQFKGRQRDIVAQFDNPDDWDGVTRFFKPDAPADWETLTYRQRTTAGVPFGPELPAETRPRDSNGRINGAQYTVYNNDRFQDDFSPPSQKETVKTFTTGAVYHVTPWLSAFANYAESFTPPGGATRIDGKLFVSPKSEGSDLGVRFTMLQGKFVANVIRYEGKEDGKQVSSAPYSTALQRILRTNAATDFDNASINSRGLPMLPLGYSDSSDVRTKGWELDLTANLTRNWRLRINGAFPNATQNDPNKETIAYIEKNYSTLRQIIIDAGGTMDANDVASIGPAANSLPQTPNRAELDQAVPAWNEMLAAIASRADGQKVSRMLESSGNIFTDYTFRRGFVRGLRVGFGVNYRGKQVIGYRGADTIVNPANPLTAIDDPTATALDPVYMDPYTVGTATFNYTRKVWKNKVLSVDLKISNLFDYDKPIYYDTIMRPRDGNLQTPARVATPNRFAWVAPRSYTLTTTLRF